MDSDLYNLGGNRMVTREIQKQFDLVANEYDSQRKMFIPCFDDYYVVMSRFLARSMQKPNTVLDLGAGTGLLTKYMFDHFPEAHFTLIDVSEEMLTVARKRFGGLGNLTFLTSDYTTSLPNGKFDLIVSGLSIHHLSEEEKAGLYNRVFDRLSINGWFVNFDQFNAESAEMNELYISWWYDSIQRSGLSEGEISRWQKRRSLDKENTVIETIRLLESSGFGLVECIYSYMKFGVIVAKR